MPEADPSTATPDAYTAPRRRGCLARCWRLGYRTVAVLVLMYLALAVYYSLGSPKQTVDYVAKVNARAAAVPEQDRAWPVYRDALVAMGLENRDDNPNLEIFKGAVVPEEPGWPETSAFVRSHRDQVAQLRAAAGMPGMGYIVRFDFDDADRALFPEVPVSGRAADVDAGTGKTLIELPFRHFFAIRRATRVLAIDALLAAEDGDGATCAADLVATIQLGGHADEHVSLLSQLTRMFVNAIAVLTVNRVIVDHSELLSDEELGTLADAFASIAGLSLDYEGERLTFDDFVQQHYTDNGRGGGHLYLANDRDFQRGGFVGRAWRFIATPVMANASASRRELTEEYHRLIDIAQAQADVPRWREPGSQFTQAVMEYSDTLIRRYRFRLIRTLLPAIGAARNTAERNKAMIEAAQVGIALEQFRRAHGGYPTSLDELVPQFLDELPVDRITGGPLRYRIGDNGPVLYSVGADGDDDGGFAPGEYGDQGPLPGTWQADTYAAARWGSRGRDAVDGDWVVWPQHDMPVLPEPERGPEFDGGFLFEDE